MEDFLGKFISVNCGEVLGVFQGQIVHVDSCTQKITLEKVFHNGCPYLSRQVIISGMDIKGLEMIDAYSDPSQLNSTKIKKPVAKKAASSSYDTQSVSKDIIMRDSPRKGFEENKSNNNYEIMKTPNKKERQRMLNSRDKAAFGSPVDQHMQEEFDFEKNLALFNKKAFYEELNASKPDVVKQTDKKGGKYTWDKKEGKYRWDENVLDSKPAAFRQLLVPQPGSVEYVTDSGLVVPSLSPYLRKLLFTTAEVQGLKFERQSEIIGRACTEMAMHLLGGAHRLNPQNQHQCPRVIVLCSPKRNGAQGINCARQLASHGVRTTVFIQDSKMLSMEAHYELELYRKTSNALSYNEQALYTIPVDLIILALSDAASAEGSISTSLARWVNENRAQVLALDPPQNGIPGVNAKCSLVPALPLSYDSSNGKIYLCNIGIPLQVFKEVGITYVPPFGPKFFMPLYPNDM